MEGVSLLYNGVCKSKIEKTSRTELQAKHHRARKLGRMLIIV